MAKNNDSRRTELKYMGVAPVVTPELRIVNRAPTNKDFKLYDIGTIWMESQKSINTPFEAWCLTDKKNNNATWTPFVIDAGISFPNHAVLLSAGDGETMNSVSPGAAGLPLISGGGSADPSFTALTPAGGGSGLTSYAAHNLFTGNGTAAWYPIAPSSTVGYPLASNGLSSDPSFSPLLVAGGGTSLQALNEYEILCGGTTSNGTVQQVSGVGAAAQLLTSNGVDALPSWQDAPAASVGGLVEIITFTSSGTYTPPSNLLFCEVEAVGAGGGSAGISALTISEISANTTGGGGGGYCKKMFNASDFSGAITVTVGSGGAAGIATSSGNTVFAGSNGSDTTFGAFLTASGGIGSVEGTLTTGADGGLGGTGTGGDVNANGERGGSLSQPSRLQHSYAGIGGASMLSGGSAGSSFSGNTAPANPGLLYGGGASGAAAKKGYFQSGSVGANGIIIITEVLS